MNRTRFLGLFILLALGLMPTAQAAICRVAVNGNGNGMSWASPMALQAALANNDCVEVWVRKGLYKPVIPANPNNPTQAERRISFNVRPGTRVYGGFAGNESLRDQRNAALHRSVLSGDIDNDDTVDADGVVTDADGNRNGNSYHVVLMDGSSAGGSITPGTVLDGLVITSGRSNGVASDRLNAGGGLLCRANNSGQTCSPTLRDILFSGNVASYGGAMYNLGITGGSSKPQLNRVHFSNNRATTYGGAMYNDGSNAGTASPVLREVRFTGNRANSYGGALFNDGTQGNSSPLLEQVQFSGNSGSFGGAIYSDATSSGSVRATLNNVTFHGNSASGHGGAMYNYATSNGDARMTLTHVTFSGNSAAQGGAMANYGASANPSHAGPTMRGVILWGNSASGGGPEVHNINAAPTIHASIVSGGCPAGSDCVGVINANPLLGALADNGGWTWTMLPGNGSAAIDAADDGFCPTIDQRGVPRAQGSRCDIGAAEVEVAPCYVNAAASGANNGSTWSNAYTSLQTALGSASCGEIRVARGVYKPTTGSDRSISFDIRPGQRVYGGFSGTEVRLDQRDPARNRTVLSGDIDNNDITDGDGIVVSIADRHGSNSFYVVRMDGTTAAGRIRANTVLDGFAITAGAGIALGTAGGGMSCDGRGPGGECSPTLTNLLFSANASDSGGGLYNNGSGGGVSSPILTNVTFRNNVAYNFGGGGMYNTGRGGVSSPTLTNVTFVGNGFVAMVNEGSQGGISSPTLNHVTFANNRGRFDSASMYNDGRNGTSEPVLTNVIFWSGTLSVPEEPSECGHVEICNVSAAPVISASVIAGGCPSASLCDSRVTSVDPQLEPLADNGGVAPTLLPGLDGSAVDAGDDATCAAFDQRGASRPQGLGCDIGAVEAVTDGSVGDRMFADGFEAG